MTKQKKSTTDKIKSIFVTGIIALLPLVVTVYILKIMYVMITSNLVPLFKRLLKLAGIQMSEALVGVATVILFVVVVFFIGLLVKNYVGKILLGLVERVVSSIPIASSLYSAIKQMVDSFSSSNNNFEKVVMLEFAGNHCMGLVVRNTQPLIEGVINESPCYNVFIPTAPNPTSGYVVVIPVNKCQELPISVDEGIKFILSAGMITFDNSKINKKLESN